MGYILKQKKVFIYGCGAKGKKLKKLLENSGVRVIGFIDSRAKDVGLFEGVQSYVLSDVAEIESKDDYAIILAFKNVFEHNEIALTLQTYGFFNVIFKPKCVLENCNTNKELEKISCVHEMLLDDEIVWGKEVPSIEKSVLFNFHDCAIIDDRADEKKVFLPCECIFFENEDRYGIWKDKNFMQSYPPVDMYRAFNGEFNNSYIEAINEFVSKVAMPVAESAGIEITSTWKDHVISGRVDVFNTMKRKMSLDADFFLRNCTTVEQRGQGTFYLKSSGKNRVCFMIAAGYRYIPVKIPSIQYLDYVNAKECESFIEYILEQHISHFFAPIPHPYFYNYSYKAEDYVEKWLMNVGRILFRFFYEQEMQFKEVNNVIYDGLRDEGCSSRFFKNLKYNVVRMREQANETEQAIDRLLNISIDYTDETESIVSENGIVMLSVDKNMEENFLEKIGTPLLYFLQISENKKDILQQIERKGFYSKKIFSSYWEDQFVEGYVCVREDKREQMERVVFD